MAGSRRTAWFCKTLNYYEAPARTLLLRELNGGMKKLKEAEAKLKSVRKQSHQWRCNGLLPFRVVPCALVHLWRDCNGRTANRPVRNRATHPKTKNC